MTLAIYRKGANSYVLQRSVFPGESTEDLFREIRNKRDLFRINADYEGTTKYPAFTIAGLSEDLRVLDAALMLSGLPRLERKVEMLIADIGVYQGSICLSIMETDVLKAKLINTKGKP